MVKILEEYTVNASAISECFDKIYTASNKFGVPLAIST